MITELNKFGPFAHKRDPFNHQQKTLDFSKMMEYYALFWEMGAGKTKPILDTAAQLFLEGETDGLLVISDKGCYRNWIDNEIPGHMMENIPMRQVVWSSAMRADQRRASEEILKAKDDILDVVVMNVEAFSSGNAPAYAREFLQNHYAMTVVDESTSIKTLDSKRSQNVIALRDYCQYRRILTGTPITNGPLDLYAQCEFLKQGLLGFTSFVAFRAYYAEMFLEKQPGRRPYYQILGYQNLEVLAETIKPFSSRILKKECLDLPDKVYETYYVEHTAEQARIYDELKKQAMSLLTQGMVTAVSALTAMTKLHQVNCGHVKNDDKTTVDIPSNRVQAVLDLGNVIDGKIIIWACFRRDIELLIAGLSKEFGRQSVVHYYGDTTDDQRQEHSRRFINDPSCLFMVANPATAGKGNTWVVAHWVIYFSNSFHLERRLQSEDRNHRPGQTNKCTYIDLVVPKTIDVKVVRALKEKKDLASEVLDVYRDMIS